MRYLQNQQSEKLISKTVIANLSQTANICLFQNYTFYDVETIDES